MTFSIKFKRILLIADARNRSFLLDVSRLKLPRKEGGTFHQIFKAFMTPVQCTDVLHAFPKEAIFNFLTTNLGLCTQVPHRKKNLQRKSSVIKVKVHSRKRLLEV